MGTRKMTNVLLLSILLCLAVLVLRNLPAQEASAQPILPSPTPMLDACITTSAYDKPASYLHVVIHDVSPIQSSSELGK